MSRQEKSRIHSERKAERRKILDSLTGDFPVGPSPSVGMDLCVCHGRTHRSVLTFLEVLSARERTV
jgi:hypothetical protein